MSDPYSLAVSEEGRRLLKKVHDRCTEEGDCWMWTQAVNSGGYPQMSHEGRGGVMVKREVLLACGKKPIGKRNRATSECGNRLCCNPAHLRWKPFGELLSEAYKTGRRSSKREYFTRLESAKKIGMVKLDWQKVEEIRRRCMTERCADIAKDYGVKEKCIAAIKYHRSWKAAWPMGVA